MKPIVTETQAGEILAIWPTPEAILAGVTQDQFEQQALANLAHSGKPSSKLDVKVTQLPHEHRWARNAWKKSGNLVVVDMVSAKSIAHDKRRARREKLLEPLDKLATSPNNSIKNKAMTDKQAVLDADAPVQIAIDAATTPEQLKQILVSYSAV